MIKHYQFKLGDFDCIVFNDFAEKKPLTEIFPDIPPGALTAARLELGVEEIVEFGYNLLLVSTGETTILIDCGMGSIAGSELFENLRLASISPEDIDVLVITHGDYDHIGGLLDSAGEITFRNAQIIYWNTAWDLWTNPNSRTQMLEEFVQAFERNGSDQGLLDQVAERRETYAAQVMPKIKDRVKLVSTDEEFLPGFRLIALPGHRSDHVGVEISSQGQTLIHVSDSIFHPIQASHPDFYCGLDTYPEQIVATNKKLLQRAAQLGALLLIVHYTFPGLVRVSEKEDTWEMTAHSPSVK